MAISTTEEAPSTTTTTRPGSVGIKAAIVVAAFSIVIILVLQWSPQKDRSTPLSTFSSESITKSSSIHEHKRIVVSFFNEHDVDLDIFWVDQDGKEVKMGMLPAGDSQEFTTYVGHIWILRISDNGERVKTFNVVDEMTTQIHSRYETPFHEQYFKENGFSWLNVYPRPPMTKWIPDPVAIGHSVERQVGPDYYKTGGGVADLSSNRALTMTTLSVRPKVFVVDDFLSDDECDHIIELALESGDLKRSSVAAKESDVIASKGDLIDARTSSNTWLEPNQSKIMENIFRRGFNLMHIEFDETSWRNHSESIQVLRYQRTQEYQPHDDFFIPSDYPNYEAVQTGRNRYGTLFLYLNDVEEGGETVFPRFGGGQPIDDACTNPNGFKVTPKKGRAALFFSMLPDGNLDRNTLHGGCPVIEGEKWAANFWFWDPMANQF